MRSGLASAILRGCIHGSVWAVILSICGWWLWLAGKAIVGLLRSIGIL